MGKLEFLFLLQTFTAVLPQLQRNNCTVTESYILCKDAQGKFLPSVPRDTIKYIFISKCDMSSLSPEDFALFPEVTKIEIRFSKVSLLAQNSLFSELSDLRDLRIEHSDVGGEVAATFADNYFLERLSLRNNRITSITRQMFETLTHLQELDLSGNDVSVLEDGFLEELQDIRTLNLSGNALDGVSPWVAASTSSRCTVCRSKGIPGRCLLDEGRRCIKGRQLDQLWWRIATLTVHIQGNPLCDGLSAPIRKNQSSSELYLGDLECETLLEDCFQHENRKMFFMEACGITYSIISNVTQEIQSLTKAGTKNWILVSVGAVLGVLGTLFLRRIQNQST